MKKTFLLFLFTFMILFSLPVKASSTDKKNFPFEITSVKITNTSIKIEGWGMAVNSHHYNSTTTHDYSLILTSDHDQVTFHSEPLYNSQTNTMRVLNVRKCNANEFYKQGGTCYYNYDYVGFSFEIPLRNLKIDEIYEAKLAVHSNILGFTKYTDVFYPILTPVIQKKGKIEYQVSSNLYETQLTIADYAVFERIQPAKNSKIRQTSTLCNAIYGYNRFFDEGSVYTHVYDRYVNESTVYYKVKTGAATVCKLGRNVVSEGTTYDSWIAGNWVDFSGEPLKIKVTDTNQPPIIDILEHPTITTLQTDDFNFKNYIKASDPEDGVLTDKVTLVQQVDISKPGKYDLLLQVKDQDGKKAENTLHVTVVEGNTPPVISAEDVTLYQYDTFDYLANVSAYDKQDGNVSNTLTYQGVVNTSELGQYEVTYTAHDSKNFYTSKTIVVRVIRNPKEKLRYISTKEDLLFYKEAIPINWTGSIQYLIEQLQSPKEFIKERIQL